MRRVQRLMDSNLVGARTLECCTPIRTPTVKTSVLLPPFGRSSDPFSLSEIVFK